MHDLFISYARPDRPVARQLAQGLTANGWSVWWDEDIRSGIPFDEMIEAKLQEAACVIVVWSQHSVRSQWVRAEAAFGLKRGILVSLRIENGIELPLQFTNIQTLEILDKETPDKSPEFQTLIRDIERVIDATEGNRPSAVSRESLPKELQGLVKITPTTHTSPTKSRLLYYIAFGVLAVLLILIGISRFLVPKNPQPMQASLAQKPAKVAERKPEAAENWQLKGRVIDEASHKAISNAEVNLWATGEVIGRFTDATGTFILQLPASVKTGRLKIRAPGYEAFDINVDSSTREREIHLRPLRRLHEAAQAATVTKRLPDTKPRKDGGPEYQTPQINDRTIDCCIISPSFPELRQQACIDEARQVIVDQFCVSHGYTKGSKWIATDTHAFQNSYKLHYDRDREGAANARWVEDNGGGCIFTYILCGE